MQLPKVVVDALHEGVRRWPELAKGDDNARRELIKRIAEQVAAVLGPNWGNKKRRGLGDEWRSKDSIAYLNADGSCDVWDTMNGTTREVQVSEGEQQKYHGSPTDPAIEFMPVAPIDHFGWVVPVDPEEPKKPDPEDNKPIPLPMDLTELIDALNRIATVLEKGLELRIKVNL